MRWPLQWPASRARLSASDRRALRLGAWIVGPALFLMLVVQPWRRALRDAGDDLTAQRASLGRELAALRDAPGDASLVRQGWLALGAEGSRLFDGGDAAAASAELASYVADQVAESGMTLDESETRAATDSDAVAAVEIRASGDVLGVVALLQALEDGPRLARTERLTIAPPPGADEDDGTLVLTATVTGLARHRHALPSAQRSVASDTAATPGSR